MAANETKKDRAEVAYTSFRTLVNTLDRMKEQGGAPSRVDRSYLANMPGGERGIFMTALKSLGLVTDGLEPTDDLHALVDADESGRVEIMRRVVERVYAAALALPKRATQSQLEAVFREYGVSGSTMRRAISFFLAATEFAGIDRSPHFKLPPRDRRPKKAQVATLEAEHRQAEIPPPPPAPPAKSELDGLDPFIVGLVRRLPAPGEIFTQEMRKAWIDTATNIFTLIYKTGDDSTEARHKPPQPEEPSG